MSADRTESSNAKAAANLGGQKRSGVWTEINGNRPSDSRITMPEKLVINLVMETCDVSPYDMLLNGTIKSLPQRRRENRVGADTHRNRHHWLERP